MSTAATAPPLAGHIQRRSRCSSPRWSRQTPQPPLLPSLASTNAAAPPLAGCLRCPLHPALPSAAEIDGRDHCGRRLRRFSSSPSPPLRRRDWSVIFPSSMSPSSSLQRGPLLSVPFHSPPTRPLPFVARLVGRPVPSPPSLGRPHPARVRDERRRG
jgi:hypothetical protein